MKTKNILAILAALTVAFIYPEVTMWLVPLAISAITLGKFGKYDIGRYIGLLSIKQVLMMLFAMFISNFGFLERLYALYSYEITSALLWIVPELIMTLIIVYFFRHLFHSNKLVWLFLIGDIIRWLSLSIEFLIPDPIIEPFFYTQFYVSVFFLVAFPSLYAAVGFISARERFLSENFAY